MKNGHRLCKINSKKKRNEEKESRRDIRIGVILGILAVIGIIINIGLKFFRELVNLWPVSNWKYSLFLVFFSIISGCVLYFVGCCGLFIYKDLSRYQNPDNNLDLNSDIAYGRIFSSLQIFLNLIIIFFLLLMTSLIHTFVLIIYIILAAAVLIFLLIKHDIKHLEAYGKIIGLSVLSFFLILMFNMGELTNHVEVFFSNNGLVNINIARIDDINYIIQIFDENSNFEILSKDLKPLRAKEEDRKNFRLYFEEFENTFLDSDILYENYSFDLNDYIQIKGEYIIVIKFFKNKDSYTITSEFKIDQEFIFPQSNFKKDF